MKIEDIYVGQAVVVKRDSKDKWLYEEMRDTIGKAGIVTSVSNLDQERIMVQFITSRGVSHWYYHPGDVEPFDFLKVDQKVKIVGNSRDVDGYKRVMDAAIGQIGLIGSIGDTHMPDVQHVMITIRLPYMSTDLEPVDEVENGP